MSGSLVFSVCIFQWPKYCFQNHVISTLSYYKNLFTTIQLTFRCVFLNLTYRWSVVYVYCQDPSTIRIYIFCLWLQRSPIVSSYRSHRKVLYFKRICPVSFVIRFPFYNCLIWNNFDSGRQVVSCTNTYTSPVGVPPTSINVM